MSVGEILEAVRALTMEERAQVKALIDSLPSESPDEESLQHRLVAVGLLRRAEVRTDRQRLGLQRIGLRSTTPDSLQGAKSTPRRPRPRHAPVSIKGEPLSETIIADRG